MLHEWLNRQTRSEQRREALDIEREKVAEMRRANDIAERKASPPAGQSGAPAEKQS